MTKTGWLRTGDSKHVKVMPVVIDQYLRDQLSKDNHTDLLGDILRHFKDHPQKDDGITHMEANPDTETHAVPLSDSKLSYAEIIMQTLKQNCIMIVQQRTAKSFLSLPSRGEKVKKMDSINFYLGAGPKSSTQRQEASMIKQLYLVMLSEHVTGMSFTDPVDSCFEYNSCRQSHTCRLQCFP